MSQDSREQFEQAYCEENSGVDLAGKVLPGALAALKEMRMGESYKDRKAARAWYWWKRARAGVVVVLPEGVEPFGLLDPEEVAAKLEASGVKVGV